MSYLFHVVASSLPRSWRGPSLFPFHLCNAMSLLSSVGGRAHVYIVHSLILPDTSTFMVLIRRVGFAGPLASGNRLE